MSKELEAIKYLNDTCINFLDRTKELYCTVTFTRKRAEILRYNIAEVEKSLKALEIIKEKRVNVGTFIHLTKILKKDYEQCKSLNNTFGANICETEKEFLTEEEFNLLKEILKC